MRSNSHIGSYTYGAPISAHPHAPTLIDGDPLSYDLNGNMTSSPSQVPGFADRVMSYDAENRPLSVMHQGDTTTYTYGADGSRLLRVEPGGDIVATFGPVEIRDFGGVAEEVLTYPHPNIRLHNGGDVRYLHHDQLGSVRTITTAAGGRQELRTYRPFGEIGYQLGAASPQETLGFIGERYDTDAGLQYLNARYYDPALGIFIQPDWFEVTAAGVGTNRYAYSFNDPINARDPMGNSCDASNLSGSGHCDRSETYQELSEDPFLASETSFLHAAAAVTWALADVDRTRIAQFLGGGRAAMVPYDVREFLEHAGQQLFEYNMQVVDDLRSGQNVFGLDPSQVTVAELDRAWVRSEQGIVQGLLDGLQSADSDLYERVVTESSEAVALLSNNWSPPLRGNISGRILNRQQAAAADMVSQQLGTVQWDFGNVDHRIMMGYAATRLARERLGLR